ncbi:MAG: type II toxin-antitoxin system RelE/ParE family toxin [Clostridia bacterium]|nr:type II toxin-antitoxin system RelE/ParE family toxin [Clostridia bacterium]
MYKLKITEAAQNDIESIVDYIAVQLDNRIAAIDFLNAIEKCYSHLSDNPYIFAKSSDARLEQEGYRKARIKNYLLMFKIREDRKEVFIYRVFYSASNYFELL